MSTAQRIKGQEVSILIIRDGELQETLTDIQNFNAEFEFEVKTQGYLGEKTNRKDFIFNGAKFDMEMNAHSEDIFTLIKAARDKAQRITPDTIFNIAAVFSFPNGDAPELLFNDVSFGAMPVNIGARGDYVKHKIQGEVSDIDVELS